MEDDGGHLVTFIIFPFSRLREKVPEGRMRVYLRSMHINLSRRALDKGPHPAFGHPLP
jgi:hypothetical protein